MNGNFGAEGDGTENNPYKIEDIEDFLAMLRGMKQESEIDAHSYFDLIADLDFSEFDEYKWEFPNITIAANFSYFTLNGKNHTIKNMIFRKSSKNSIF